MQNNRHFKARAHLLKLLGDQLIGNDRLAIFELVKNAYDANATEVNVLLDLESNPPKIRIQDNGFGMDIETIENKWLELGTNSKRGDNRKPTPPPFERLPLGEKGVGRLAVHKLGTKLKLITRSEGNQEYSINVDWPELIKSSEYINDASVDIVANVSPVEYLNNTGTLLEVTGLHQIDWTRRDVRALAKLIKSLVSPFQSVYDFKVTLKVPGRESWLSDLPDVEDILDRAIWSFEFEINNDGEFSWSYKFNPPFKFKSIGKRSLDKKDFLELSPSPYLHEESDQKHLSDNLILSSDMLSGIGPIKGKCYFYYLRKEVLGADGNYAYIKDYLNDQTGIRIYRDGIRVFNYGEPGDDWLGLNLRRINKPTEMFGPNSIISGISLNLRESFDVANGVDHLQEKTNREGFDENGAYKRFRWIVSSIFDKFFNLHRTDREEIDRYLGDIRDVKKPSPDATFEKLINEVNGEIKKHGLEKEIGNKIDYINSEYLRMREVALNTGKGLNLSIIFHEVEREIFSLNTAIKNQATRDVLIQISEHLVSLLEGFQPLLRRNEQKTFEISKVIQNTVSPMQRRLQYHKIILSTPILTKEDIDFTITAPYGLVMSGIQNIIENAMYWSRLQAEKNSTHSPAIGIFTLVDCFEEGPAIVIADNGPGFSLNPEDAIKPFVTDRPGGQGLGLYFVNLVMENIGGRLLFMTPDELELPSAYAGAAVVLLFKTRKK
ncbi:ATP-binding protein [Methylomonas fluvii]|uniref:ATP-binding protein n=1 Tax=Methylomonas fluvii TaxID=1854564 RepID=A0ABR9D980_9GAMM|nr:ATP-binding protein [Methylomonas fluvii]MBD9359671.1 ATP-binding protein [Methylomonas fluvii]